jgi:2-polyprenyl-3-methyl-5-hydroxy-6-metoxy-1,4-benzoquinol methylase
MELINVSILEQSDFVKDIYSYQHKLFSRFELPVLADIINKHNIKSVLDIGTGEGTFITDFASKNKNLKILAIDGDKKLISLAKSRNENKNLLFESVLFNSKFSQKKFDLILARFSVEHMNNPTSFIEEVKKRLNPDGHLIVTEYLIEWNDENTKNWKFFRKKELELYTKFGSHPRLPLILPQIFQKNSLQKIEAKINLISPSTSNVNDFNNLIVAYVLGYSKIAPDVFTPLIVKRFLKYLNEDKNQNYSEDRLIISLTIGQNSK